MRTSRVSRRPAESAPAGSADPAPGVRESLYRFLDRGLVVKLIAALLVFTAVPLAEIFLFIYIGHLIGNFLVLVLAVVAGAAGALVAADQAGRSLARLRTSLEPGRRPGPDLTDLAGVLAGSVLLLTPGFITDLCGFALMVPVVRRAVGRLASKALGSAHRDVLNRLAAVQSLKIR